MIDYITKKVQYLQPVGLDSCGAFLNPRTDGTQLLRAIKANLVHDRHDQPFNKNHPATDLFTHLASTPPQPT
eukprot:scaffold6130_cov131-Cylindrotheca_fusiformis.AAC.2